MIEHVDNQQKGDTDYTCEECQHKLAHYEIIIDTLDRYIDSAIELIAGGLTDYRPHGAIKNMIPLQDALRRVTIVGDAAEMECIFEYESMVEIFGRGELIAPNQLENALKSLLGMKPRQRRLAGEDVQTMIRVAHFNRHRDDVHDVIDDRDDSADDLKHMNVTVH